MASARMNALIADVKKARQEVERLEHYLATAKETRANAVVKLYRHEDELDDGSILKLSSRAVAELAGITNPTVLRLNEAAR